MSFFHNLNKRLADLAAKQDAQQITESAKAVAPKSKLAQALNERDLGKHNNATTGFAALAKKTGGGEKGAKIAGAQLAKMRAKGQVEESDMEEGLGNALKNIGGNIKQGYLDNRANAAEKAYYNQDFSSDEYAKKRGVAKQKADMYRAQRQAVAGQPAVTDGQVEESDMEEGNEFSGELAQARAAGAKQFKVDGKSYPVKEEGGMPMTPKQKSFAKLAPPVDKITFADKIAGAKKEVDEMLGDVAAEAIKGAIGKKKNHVARAQHLIQKCSRP